MHVMQVAMTVDPQQLIMSAMWERIVLTAAVAPFVRSLPCLHLLRQSYLRTDVYSMCSVICAHLLLLGHAPACLMLRSVVRGA